MASIFLSNQHLFTVYDIDTSLQALLTLAAKVVDLMVDCSGITLDAVDSCVGADNLELVNVTICTCDGNTDDAVSCRECALEVSFHHLVGRCSGLWHCDICKGVGCGASYHTDV